MRVEITLYKPYKVLKIIDLLIVPIVGDFIDLEYFFNENIFNEEEFEAICNSTWCIDSRRWSKDSIGIYVQLFCHGE